MTNEKRKEELLTKIQNLLNTTTDKGASESEAQTAILLAQKLMAKHGLEMSDVEASGEPVSKEVAEAAGQDKGGVLQWWEKNLAKIIADNFRCYTFTRGYGRRYFIVFMGLKEDTEIAKGIFKFASAQIEHHARQYRRSRKKELEKRLPGGFKKWSIEELKEFAESVDVPYRRVDAAMAYDTEAMKRKYLTSYIKEALGLNIDGVALRNDYVSGFLKGLSDKLREQQKANEAEWGLVLVKDTDVVAKYESMNFTKGKASKVSSSGDAEAYSAGVKQGKAFSSASGELE